MLVYLRDGSAKTIVRAATLRQVADQTFYLTRSRYTDTGPTDPSADPLTPGAWQGSHWSTNFFSRPENPMVQAGLERTPDLLSRRTP